MIWRCNLIWRKPLQVSIRAPWTRPSARSPASYRAGWRRSPHRTVGASSRSPTYDNIGNLISVTKPMGSANAPTTTVYIYDADRRKIGEIGPAPTGDGHYRATRTTYDGDGRVTLTETGYTTSQSATALSTFVSLEQAATVYDASGRKIQDTHSGGGVTSTLTQYSYDAQDRLVCTAVRMNQSAFASLMATYSSTTYTASGVLPTAACSLGPQGSDGPDRITYRTYDAAGQLLTTVSGYGTSVQRTDHTSTWTLDGKEATAADGKGNLTTFVYDGFDRLSQALYPNPTNGSVSSTTDYEQYGYDSQSNMSYDDIGRRTGISRGDGVSTSHGYDGISRLTSLTHPMVGGDVQSQTYGLAYTASSQIKTLTQSNAAYQFPAFDANLTYTVNGQNQLTSSGGATIGYHARGNLNFLRSDLLRSQK